MLRWLLGRKLEDVVYASKAVRVHGVKLRIRKLNPLDYMAGTKSLRQLYSTYQVQGGQSVEVSGNQARDIKGHYVDTFLQAVVEPKLKRNASDSGEGLPVEHLLTDWDFANELYQRILEHTYGKKNLKKLLTSSKTAAMNSTS